MQRVRSFSGFNYIPTRVAPGESSLRCRLFFCTREFAKIARQGGDKEPQGEKKNALR